MTYERKNPIPMHHQEILIFIGKKVKELRKQKNLSIEMFCYTYKIPRISYSNLEVGKNFHMTTLLNVLDAHKDIISLKDFFKDF